MSAPGQRVTLALIVLGLATTLGLATWDRRATCEREGQSIEAEVLGYEDRLALRELMRDAPADAPSWNDVRLRLEADMREWSELRTRACIKKRGNVERCLDQQKQQLSELVDAWIAGERSWATTDLDQLLPQPSTCADLDR